MVRAVAVTDKILIRRPSISDIRPLYRRTYCWGCGRDTWLKWMPGHRWTCLEKPEHVRQENVWNGHNGHTSKGPTTEPAPRQLALELGE